MTVMPDIKANELGGCGDSGKNCQQTGEMIMTMLMQLARESASDGSIRIAELSRITGVIKGMAPIYEMARRRCQAEQMCQSIAFRRSQILGRIIAHPLEPLLFACPPVLSRAMLTPLFDTVRLIIGDTTYALLEERAREIYFGMLKTYDYFEWQPFYDDPEVVRLFNEVIAKLAHAFCTYDDTKRWFIGHMDALLDGRDGLNFGQAEFFTVFTALLRPLQLSAEASPYRARLEQDMHGESGTIQSFLDVFLSDKKRFKKVEAVLRN